MVTTGKASKQATEWAKGKPISFVEMDDLIQMIDAAFPEGVVPRDWKLPASVKPPRAKKRVPPKRRRTR